MRHIWSKLLSISLLGILAMCSKEGCVPVEGGVNPNTITLGTITYSLSKDETKVYFQASNNEGATPRVAIDSSGEVNGHAVQIVAENGRTLACRGKEN